MILFIVGLFIGWFFGIIVAAIFAVGKREDELIDKMYKKFTWI